MSKYNDLWEYVSQSGKDKIKLSFEDVYEICAVRIDHSFLNYKKELACYGYKVEKISMKENGIVFAKI